jgi:alkylation response protein AidB-like acyl-CoA dehydrogenase
LDIDLTDEQKLLADTVHSLLQQRYSQDVRLALLSSEIGWSRAMWRQYAELGLLGLPFDEQYGGTGAGTAELCVVMESFGRALVLEPFLPTVILGGALVAAVGSEDQKASILPDVAAGETLLAFAHTEGGSRWSLTDIATSAQPSGDDWRLSGQKIAVVGGDSADHLIITARMPDGDVGLFLMDAANIRREMYAMHDGTRGADISLKAAPARALGTSDDALSTVTDVLDVATTVLCWEAVGVIESMLWLTVDYLKKRVQFGKPIAVFQALQHRAAAMYVALEQARSAALVARLALDDEDVATRRKAVRAAKLQVDLAARHVGQEAVQLHGGIGMAMEYPVGHYFKRATVITKTFSDTDRLTHLVGTDGGLIAAR